MFVTMRQQDNITGLHIISVLPPTGFLLHEVINKSNNTYLFKPPFLQVSCYFQSNKILGVSPLNQSTTEAVVDS